MRDDEDAARAAGINPLLVRSAAMALSAALTGIGGTLFAQYFLYLDPTFMISPELSFQFALLPAVGGLGTAIGPVLGSFLITPLSELLRSYLGHAAAGLHLVIYSAGLIVVMLYFPGGIADALRRLTTPEARAVSRILEVRNLSRSFGALWAVNDVSFDVARGRAARPDRPERRRQEHALQSDRRRAEADARRDRVRRAGRHRLAILPDRPRSASPAPSRSRSRTGSSPSSRTSC